MRKVLYIIDDEKDIQDIIRLNFTGDGFEVAGFSSGEDAYKMLAKKKPDIILLDVMMPGMDGYEFCRKLRGEDHYRNIPVIFLSAKSEEFDKVLGLELGGDDYIAKPFGMKELKSRVKAVLRRGIQGDDGVSPQNGIIRCLGVELNPGHFSLTVDGMDVSLTKTEFNILYLFLKNPGKIFTRDNIIDSIRGDDIYVIDRTIDVHIMNLRKKLGAYKNMIRTISGMGYGFREIGDEDKKSKK